MPLPPPLAEIRSKDSESLNPEITASALEQVTQSRHQQQSVTDLKTLLMPQRGCINPKNGLGTINRYNNF